MGNKLRFAGHEFRGNDARQWPVVEADYPKERVISWLQQQATGEKALGHAARILGGIPDEGQLCIPFPELDNGDNRANGDNASVTPGQLALSGIHSRP